MDKVLEVKSLKACIVDATKFLADAHPEKEFFKKMNEFVSANHSSEEDKFIVEFHGQVEKLASVSASGFVTEVASELVLDVATELALKNKEDIRLYMKTLKEEVEKALKEANG